MKHVNGVDISAWARSGNGQEIGVEELEASVDDGHHDHYRKFYMRFCDRDVRFRFRLPAHFDAHGASTIHTGIFIRGVVREFWVYHTQDWRSNDTRDFLELRLPAPVEASDQGGWNINSVLQLLPPVLGEFDTRALVASPEYDVPNFSGRVRAIFQLGNSQWLNRRCSKINLPYVPDTFRRLEGAYGDMYIWDIIPVSDELFELLLTAKKESGPISGKLNDTSVPQERTTGPSDPGPVVFPCQSTSDIGLATPSLSANNEVPSVVSEARPSIRRVVATKKRSPEVCECDDPDHQPVGRKRKQKDGLDDLSSPAQRKKRVDNSGTASTRAEKSLAHEMVAGVCGQCQHLKKAPRGKKIAWRNHSKTWMVVDARAHNEEPPTEEIIERQRLPDDGSANSSTQLDHNEDHHNSGRDEGTSNTPSGSSLGNAKAFGEPAAVMNREGSPFSNPFPGTEDPVDQNQSLPQVQAAGIPSNTTTISLQGGTIARLSGDQSLHTASARATSAGVPSDGHVGSNHRSQRKPPVVLLDLTRDDDNVPVKQEVKREPKVEVEEQSLGIPQASTNSDGLENKSEAALLEELQDVELGEARTRLEEQKLLLRQKRLLLERQLKKKKQESGTPEKSIKIEDD